MKKNLSSFYKAGKMLSIPLMALLLAAGPVAKAKTFYQTSIEQRISVQINEETLETALNKIKKLDKDLLLNYRIDEVKNIKVRARIFKDQALGKVLKELLSGTGLVAEEKHNTIVIYRNVEQKVSEKVETITVNGVVKDDKGPVVGAVVRSVRTNKAVVTDLDGKYSIAVEKGDVLSFSMMGYLKQEIEVTQAQLNVVLKNDSRQLSEVVVIGYGTQQKRNVTGAIASISLKDVPSRSFNNPSEVLQGSSPGITVLNNGGDPNAAPKVRIRGIGSINEGAEPMWIIDGVPYTPAANSNGAPFSVPVNPNDIESISVLKDASAGAIYGARAGSGIIMVTTKKGTPGKPILSFDAQGGVENVWRKLKPLDAAQFAEMSNIAADNAGKKRQDAFNPAINSNALITRTHWMDEIFRTGKMQSYDLAVRGGSEFSTYSISGGYRRNDGVLDNTYSTRYSARLNSDHKINKWLTVGENLSLNYSNGNNANTYDSYTGPLISAIYYTPNMTVYSRDGSGRFGGLDDQYAGSYGDVANPVAYLKRLDNKSMATQIMANAYANIQILPGLKFRSSWSVNKNNVTDKQFTPKVPEIGKPVDINSLYQANIISDQFLSEQTLTYDKVIGKSKITALLGYTYQHNKENGFSALGQNFISEDETVRYLQNAQERKSIGGSGNETALISYLSRVMYEYNDKYFATATVRRDGASQLSPNKRWGISPAFTLGWRLSGEEFMKGITWLDDLKLRGSWGKIGDISSLPKFPTVARMATIIGADGNPGYVASNIPSRNLTWEKSNQTDIGLDMAFLKGRLSITADWYDKTTQDMLMGVDAPESAGVIEKQYVNAGKIQNRGFELGVNFNDHVNEFRYSVGASIATLKNKVLEMPANLPIINYDNNVRQQLYPNRTYVGQPLFAFYGVQTAGIFQSADEVKNYVGPDGTPVQKQAVAGDLKFVDRNGDGRIDDLDKTFLGSPFPDLTYSFNANASYKNFDVSIFMQGVSGVKIFNGMKFTTLNAAQQSYNRLSTIMDAWSPQNPSGTIPRISASDNNKNFGTVSDFYIEDGSYLRLKSATIGYTFPKTMVGKAGINKLRVYVTGQNLFTITKYTGFDPEVGLDQLGIDLGRYPQSRMYVLGLQLGF